MEEGRRCGVLEKEVGLLSVWRRCATVRGWFHPLCNEERKKKRLWPAAAVVQHCYLKKLPRTFHPGSLRPSIAFLRRSSLIFFFNFISYVFEFRETKILKKVSSIKLHLNNTLIHITIRIIISYFQKYLRYSIPHYR